MDSEILTALDDTEQSIDGRHIPTAPFSPPSLSSSQYKQLELLQHLALYSELLILFSGDKGVGKTFLANSLIASREAPDQSLLVDCDFSTSYLDILHIIAQHFDLAELNEMERLESEVLQYCGQLLEEEQGSFLLILDQAEQLSNETLLHINQLALILPNALHVMLLATPNIEETLLALPEPHAPLHIMDVDGLSEDEAEIILLQQFPEKEWSGDDVDYILSQSKGNVGKLVYLAQQLISGVKPPAVKVANKFPITHIAAIVLIASAFLMSYLYQGGEDAELVESNIELKKITLSESTASQQSLEPMPNFSDEDSLKEEIIKSLPDEEVDFNFIEPVPVASVSAAEREIIAIASPVNAAPVKEVTAAEVKKEIVSIKSSLTANEKILSTASSTSFIAQLFGSHSEKNAKVFIKQHASKADSLLYYRSEHKGKPWFVVVSGPYVSKVDAKKKVALLPAGLRKQNPWIRSVKPIQQLLKARR